MSDYKEFEDGVVEQLGLPRKGSKWLNIYSSEQYVVHKVLYSLDEDANLDELIVYYSGNFLFGDNNKKDIGDFLNMHSEVF